MSRGPKPRHSQQPPGVVPNWSTLQCSKDSTKQCGYDHAPVTRGRMRAQFPLPHGPLGYLLFTVASSTRTSGLDTMARAATGARPNGLDTIAGAATFAKLGGLDAIASDASSSLVLGHSNASLGLVRHRVAQVMPNAMSVGATHVLVWISSGVGGRCEGGKVRGGGGGYRDLSKLRHGGILANQGIGTPHHWGTVLPAWGGLDLPLPSI